MDIEMIKEKARELIARYSQDENGYSGTYNDLLNLADGDEMAFEDFRQYYPGWEMEDFQDLVKFLPKPEELFSEGIYEIAKLITEDPDVLVEAHCQACGGWDKKQGGNGHYPMCPVGKAGTPISGPSQTPSSSSSSIKIIYDYDLDPADPIFTNLPSPFDEDDVLTPHEAGIAVDWLRRIGVGHGALIDLGIEAFGISIIRIGFYDGVFNGFGRYVFSNQSPEDVMAGKIEAMFQPYLNKDMPGSLVEKILIDIQHYPPFKSSVLP